MIIGMLATSFLGVLVAVAAAAAVVVVAVVVVVVVVAVVVVAADVEKGEALPPELPENDSESPTFPAHLCFIWFSFAQC